MRFVIAIAPLVLLMWSAVFAADATQAQFPAWDGKESVAEYALRAKLDPTKSVDLGNGVKLEMVLIPAGTFTMGSPANEEGRFPIDNEGVERQHEVTISAPFYMGKYDVTQVQWETVMGSNPSNFKGPQNPVEQVSWSDAQKFMARAGNGIKLPTEAQWEYACRAGTATRFYSGNSDADLERIAWFGVEKDGSTHPVGQKQPNTFGLYDMLGNVFQWCEDWFGDRYYESSPRNDPSGPESGAHHVVRGGSWRGDALVCRSAARGRYRILDLHDNRFGFRVVMPMSKPPAPVSPIHSKSQ